jgi:hypothetical protein
MLAAAALVAPVAALVLPGGPTNASLLPLRPTWPFRWDKLSVWASGQGVTDFSVSDSHHYARFDVLWTQGMRWNPPPRFSGDYVPFVPPRAGYETWEAAIISDARKVRAINPHLPVLGYYGWAGCCTGRNEWWLSNYTSPESSNLWLRDDTGHVVYTGDSAPLFRPVWDLCKPATVDFINTVVLRDFMKSDDIGGVFFDSVTSYTGLGRFGIDSGYKNASFGAASRVRIRATTRSVSCFNPSNKLLCAVAAGPMLAGRNGERLGVHDQQGQVPNHVHHLPAAPSRCVTSSRLAAHPLGQTDRLRWLQRGSGMRQICRCSRRSADSATSRRSARCLGRSTATRARSRRAWTRSSRSSAMRGPGCMSQPTQHAPRCIICLDTLTDHIAAASLPSYLRVVWTRCPVSVAATSLLLFGESPPMSCRCH